MIRIKVHANNSVIADGESLDQITSMLETNGSLVWIDAIAAEDADITFLKTHFGFHPLALEDISRHHQRPKIESYDGYSLLFFYALRCEDADRTHVEFSQLGMFIGKNYVVTVHDGSIKTLDEVSERWHQSGLTADRNSVGMLVYTILDALVDGYFPVLDQLSDRLDDLEDVILEQVDLKSQQEIFQIKKQLVSIRRVVAPERDVLNVLVRREMSIFDPAVIIYFQDVYDHILRVTDAVDMYRDLLSSSLEFHLAATSNRLNQVMKTLTAASIVLMSMTLVASVYGMNFVHMPELTWGLGYAWALGLMATIGGVVLALFRRNDWI